LLLVRRDHVRIAVCTQNFLLQGKCGVDHGLANRPSTPETLHGGELDLLNNIAGVEKIVETPKLINKVIQVVDSSRGKSNYSEAKIQHHQYLENDLRNNFENIIPQVYETVGENNIKEKVVSEIRLGAIVELDEVIRGYLNSEISEERYMDEATNILKQIHESKDKALLVKALVTYIDQRYEDFPWDDFSRDYPDDNGSLPVSGDNESFLPESSIRRKDDYLDY